MPTPNLLPTREGLGNDLTPLLDMGVGGLNLAQSALQMPYQDLPVARNVVVAADGVVRRRNGTYDRGTVATQGLSGAPNKVNIAALTTTFGHDFLVFRLGRTIHVRNIRGTGFGSPIYVHNTGLSVLNTVAATGTGDITILRDPRLRILTTVEGIPPLDTHVTEVRLNGITSSTFTVPRTDLIPVVGQVYRDQTITRDQLAVFINGVPTTVISVSGTSTLSIQVATTPTSTANVDVILFRSFWWAEATFQYADRYGDTVTRSNVTEADVHIPLPTNLRDGLTQRGAAPVQYSPYAIDARYWNGTAFVFYTQMSDGKPTNATQYALSDGTTRYGNNAVTPSTLYLTFGAWESGVVRPVFLTRHRKLPHNGGRGIDGNQLELALDGQRFIFSGTTTGNPFIPHAYRLWDATDTTQVTSISTKGTYLSIDAAWAQMGVWNPSSVLRAISFTNTRAPSGMERVPCYGLPYIADYGVHSYPTTTTTYQNRLVLAGMPHDPLLVAFSAVYDTRTPEEPYMFFEEDPLDRGEDTAPFTVRLDSTADDRIVGLEEYQGSLFVITKRGIFRVAATGRQTITRANYYVSSVGNVGAPNPNCIVRPEGMLMVLTRSGLYQVGNGTSANEYTEYQVTEVSTKVAPLFDPLVRQNSDTNLWWASYSPAEHLVYIGLSSPNDTYWSTECYTVDTMRGSWSEFSMLGGAQTYAGLAAKVEDGQDAHYLMMDPTSTGAFTLVQTGAPYAVDLIKDLGSTNTLQYTAPRPPTTSVNTIYNVVLGQGIASGKVYKVLHPFSPANGVNDIKVTLNGVELVNGVGYTKLPGNYILLTQEPPSSQALVVEPRSLIGGVGNNHHMVAILDGLSYAGLPFYTASGTTPTAHSWVKRLVLATTFSSVMLGVEFQSVIVSSVFTFGNIDTDKRISGMTLYQERLPHRDRWYGTYPSRSTVDTAWWPTLSTDASAGAEWAATDMPVQYYSAMVSIIADEERSQTHAIQLGSERDFYDLDEGETIGTLSRPPLVQVPQGSAVRRSFSDTLTVVQPVITSIGAYQFGLSGIELEATTHRSNPVSRTR